MSAEIGILVARFDIDVGIDIRLSREKAEGTTLLRDPSHHFAGKAVLPRLRDDEHEEELQDFS